MSDLDWIPPALILPFIAKICMLLFCSSARLPSYDFLSRPGEKRSQSTDSVTAFPAVLDPQLEPRDGERDLDGIDSCKGWSTLTTVESSWAVTMVSEPFVGSFSSHRISWLGSTYANVLQQDGRYAIVDKRLSNPHSAPQNPWKAQKALLIETPRGWQAGFAVVPLKTEHNDQAISVAQDWLHENFHRPFPLEKPARRAGMSLRKFVRGFTQATGDSPLAYLQKLRIAAAKRLLENNHGTMQEISNAVRLPGRGLFPASYFSAVPAFHPDREGFEV